MFSSQYQSDSPERDRFIYVSILVMTMVTLSLVTILIVSLLYKDRQPSINKDYQNLMMTPNELRGALSSSLEKRGITSSPRHLLVERIAFKDSWIVARLIITNKHPDDEYRTLYVVARRETNTSLEVVAVAGADQTWRDRGVDTPEDVIRKAEGL